MLRNEWLAMQGKKVGITACSNALTEEKREELERLDKLLKELGLLPVWSPHITGKEGEAAASAKERAEILNDFYGEPEIAAVFDLSGGDLANECLEWLDMEAISSGNKPFWGYSDLTTILNAVYTQTGQEGVLYQMRNLVRSEGPLQIGRMRRLLAAGDQELFTPKWEFLRGSSMEGTVVGGNLRCFLKLAGTPYFPELTGKLLFIEAWGGSPAFIRTSLSQLRQMGAFEKINGLLFGTFTAAEQRYGRRAVTETILSCMEETKLPVAGTVEIGHGADSKAIVIGKYSRMSKQ